MRNISGITIFIFVILLLFPGYIRAHKTDVAHTHEKDAEGKSIHKRKKKEEEKERKIEFKPFFTANRLLLVSGITINSTNAFGDFQLRNNTNQNITTMFGRVYRYEEQGNKKINVTLVNNPNRAAILLSAIRHKPGGESVWRFGLFKSRLIDDPRYKYTIDVNSRSLFFE